MTSYATMSKTELHAELAAVLAVQAWKNQANNTISSAWMVFKP
ncbi:hypothetical protein [Mesorhizobium waimense]|nr:hypothetical protein [Mesorhizobium waimense]